LNPRPGSTKRHRPDAAEDSLRNQDVKDLERLGYAQELLRDIGGNSWA